MEHTASYIANVETEGAHSGQNTEDFLKKMKSAENERRKELQRRYDRSKDMICFGTTIADKMGHVNTIRPHGGTTRETYSFVDHQLTQLQSVFEPEEVVVVSDHGFSGYSHDLNGFALDTSGREIPTIFDFAPTLLDHMELNYGDYEFGPQSETELSEDERDQVKDQLRDMGYF